MEIGTYKGDTAKRMIRTAQKIGVKNVEYYGTDLFEKPADYEVRFLNAGWIPPEDVKAKLERTGAKVRLIKGNTRETLPHEVPNLPKMDFIYIDGGHSYETVKCDWKYAQRLMHPDTIVVFDDYWSFEGVRRVVDGIGDGFNVGLTRHHAIVRADSHRQNLDIGYVSGHPAHERLAELFSRNRYEFPTRKKQNWVSYLLDVPPRALKISNHSIIINEGHAGKVLALVFRKAILRRKFTHIVRANDRFFNFGSFPWYQRFILRLLTRYIDGVIAISDMNEKDIRKNTNLPVRKVNTFVKDDSYLQIQPNLSARNIVTIGTDYPRKGNDILVEVDKKLREYGYRGETFVVGRKKIVPEFIKQYSRNQPHFHLTGFVEDLKEYLAKGCFYVHPARFDAAACSVVEAMAAGLIPIVSERTGNKEVVNRVDPGLVLENTPKNFYRKLSDLMELDEPELRILSDRAKEVASAYTFDKIKEDFKGAMLGLMHDIEERHHRTRNSSTFP